MQHMYPTNTRHVLTSSSPSRLWRTHTWARAPISLMSSVGLSGALRGLAAHSGFRGPFVDFMLMGSRVWVDQGVECLVGVGRVPWTWPVRDQVYELVQKAIWAFVTGYLVDRWVV
ncbi:hypothetical protein BDQ17DRAFT_1043187 [Cyathus striatus]|nr:hypothetical protein BDQ17DRAFT_1043187 [Cyathus striatus]